MMNTVDIYTTKLGDTWDLIAYRVYGSEKYMKELVEANIDLASTVFFKSGVELICPDIPVINDSNAPPWKR